MNYSYKFVLDDVAVITHQKFPLYLTRRNFKNDEAYQHFFTMLNDALIALDNGVYINQFERFDELCYLLQKEAILEPDPTLLRVDDYAADYLGKIGEFIKNSFTIDQCDQIILQHDDYDGYQRNDLEINLCTLDLAKVALFDKYLAQHGNVSTVQLSENMYGKEPSFWWREQEFEF